MTDSMFQWPDVPVSRNAQEIHDIEQDATRRRDEVIHRMERELWDTNIVAALMLRKLGAVTFSQVDLLMPVSGSVVRTDDPVNRTTTYRYVEAE